MPNGPKTKLLPRAAHQCFGHRSGRVTTHYSKAELHKLVETVNRVCKRGGKRPEKKLRKTETSTSLRISYKTSGCFALLKWIV